MNANDKRLIEARECIRKADASLKTSMIKLKFKPDYDSAASEYERAAICFKNAQSMESCRDTYLKAAECHKLNGIIFHAAKCKEQAAMVCKELGDMSRAKSLMEDAAQMYLESGTPDTSAMALEKTAKFFESVDIDKAIDIYKRAYLLVQDSDRSRMAGEFLGRLTKLYLRQEKYADAAENIETEIDTYIEVQEPGKVGRLTTELVLVQLARGDSIAADKSYQNSFKCAGFDRTDDAAMCGTLISAYESGDAEKFQQCLNRPLMRNLDNEFLRLMKTVKCPTNNVSGNTSQRVDEIFDGEDEDEEDLK